MSIAPEAVIARHCGIKVFGVSLVTNVCIFDEESNESPNHEKVLKVGMQNAKLLQNLFTAFIAQIPTA